MKMTEEERKLLFQKRTELFMKYCDINGFPQLEDKIKFCDIDHEVDDEVKIYRWFFNQSFNNPKELKENVELYKDTYPIAYTEIKNRLSNKQKKLSNERRLEYFMKYVEEHDWVSERSKIRFCDIDKEVQDTSNVGIWFGGQFRVNGDFVRNLAIQNKSIYPKASQEILSRFENIPLSYMERLKLLMQYIEEYNISILEEGLTFVDLGNLVSDKDKPKNNQDKFEVKKWFNLRNRIYQDKLIQACAIYAKQYPKAYSWIIAQTEKLIKFRNNLSFEERIFLYLAYLNQEPNKVVVSSDRLKFSDLPNNLGSNVFCFPNLVAPISDDTLISTWLRKALSGNIKALADECLKYQEIYPLGVQKIQKRIEKYKSLLSFDKKTQLLMKEIEENGIPAKKNTIRFCDLDPSCKDGSVVRTWLNGAIFRTRKRFIFTFPKYKETYPKAYEEIKNYINGSKACLRDDRKRLIETLIAIREQLVNPTEINAETKCLKKHCSNESK